MIDTLRNRLVTAWHETVASAKKKAILFDIQRTDELINGNWSEDSIEKYGKDNDETVIKRGLKGVIGRKHVDLIIGGPPCQGIHRNSFLAPVLASSVTKVLTRRWVLR